MSSPENLPALSSSPAAATQLKDLPLVELQTIARDYGIDPLVYETKPGLVAAILDRRTIIGQLDRDAMIDVLHWGGRTASASMSRERIALEIAKIRSMKFGGLSRRGLIVLAKLRGLEIDESRDTPEIILRLKKQEGFFAKIARKRRHIVGKWVSRMIGDTDEEATLAGQLPPPANREEAARAHSANGARPDPRRKLQDEIEDVGLIAGITSRVRRSADQYLNQKLDEIEARIDRKLDEIDRRLAEWRDKEVANRIRILKVSLWATVVVGAATLVISYIRVYMPWIFGG